MNKEKDTLGVLLSRSTNLIWKHMFRKFLQNGFDVTPEQVFILVKLKYYKTLSQKELAEITCKDKVSITKIITNLEKRELVIREVDLVDKRIKRISLTTKGKQITPKLKKIAKETICKSFEKIDSKELNTFKNVLINITSNLAIEKKL